MDIPASDPFAYRHGMRALDTVLPHFDVNEVHTISLACDPEQAVERALAAPAAPDRVVAALFRARGLRRATTIEALFDLIRFETLVRPHRGRRRRIRNVVAAERRNPAV